MLLRATLPLAVLFLVAPACDSKDSTASKKDAKAEAKDAKGETKDAKDKDAKADPPKKDEKESAAKAATKLPAIEAAKLEKYRKNAEALEKELATARKAAKDEDWAGAVAAYDKAIKLDDDNVHVLSELGWAHFKAGDNDKAEHNIRLALRHVRKTEERVDLLDKLGSIDEARGDFAGAKEHFDHAVGLTGGDEARKHQEAVADKAAAACADGKCTKPDFETLDDACKAMIARVHEQLGLTAETAANEFSCDPAKAQKVALEGGDATEAAILEVSGKHGDVTEDEFDLLAHIDGGWHWIGTVLDVENPNHGGIVRTGSIKSFEAKELVPDSPGNEVLVHLEFAETDIDFDDNLLYHDEQEAYLVCGMNEGKHICHEIPLHYYFESDVLREDEETEHEPEVHEFTVEAAFDGKGNVTFTGDGEVPKGLTGTKAVTELAEPEGFVFLHAD